jgi:8-amino-7-oxononanoate synthase
MNIQDLVFARIHTFGKAMGCAGAIIASSSELRDFLINFSIPFIYSTAMPPVQVYNMMFHLEYLRKNSHLISQLQSNILLFKNKAIEHEMQDRFSNFNHILNLNIGDDGLSVELMNNLCKNGFLVKAMLPPTVSNGASSLRIIMHSTNYIEEIDNLFLHVKKLF